MFTRSLAGALAVLSLLSMPAGAQPQWSRWETSAEVSAGLWRWQTGEETAYLTVQRRPEGIFEIGLSAQPTTPPLPTEAVVTAGVVAAPGVPELTFEYSAGQARCLIQATATERFFGLGEKYNSVDQRGKVAQMWVDSGYVSLGDSTYLPVPMVLSSEGYGLYLDSSRHSVFDMASDGVRVVIQNPSPGMRLYIWPGQDYPELLGKYAKITGFPAAPPEWAFGIWLSRCSYSEQAEVLRVARRWRALELPLGLLNVEGWKGGAWHTFSKERFPDPEAMIRELHEYGWKVMLWNTHNIPPDDPNYRHGDERGYFAKGQDGKTFNVPEGYGRGGSLDVTHPEAVKWWNSLYDPLLDMGVDALFNDITNYLEREGKGPMVFSDGRTSEEMHNLYWLLFNKITYEYMMEKTGGETVLRVAGGWAGQQKYSTVWAGDSAATWEFLERDIRALLAIGWSGIPYFGYDIPGDSMPEGKPSPELYMRYCQFGAFSPLMQFHSIAPTEPWHYGPDAVANLRTYGWLRENFSPYIYSLALEAEQTAAPMARSLIWHTPEDEIAAGIQDQFLLGPGVLVAPVCRPGTQRRVYLPRGNWLDIMDGSHYKGPGWIEAQAPVSHLPVYMAEGAIVPMKLDAELNAASPIGDRFVRAIQVMPPPDRGSCGFDWRRKGAKTALRCGRDGEEITVRRSGSPLPPGTVVRIECGPPERVRVDGARLKELTETELAAAETSGYWYRPSEQVLFVCRPEQWEKLQVQEKHGQVRFESWAAPAAIASNAGPAKVEVGLPLADPDTVPVLRYAYQGARGTVLGEPLPGSRWRFEVPVEPAATDSDLLWTVVTTARTGAAIHSRERVTVVQTPVATRAPSTLRLLEKGEFALELTSHSAVPTAVELALKGPEGLVLTPAGTHYDLAPGATEKVMVGYAVAPGEEGKALGLGEHEIAVQNTVQGVALKPQTILACRPFAWSVVGPFPAEKDAQWRQAFATVLPPEQGEVSLEAEYSGPDGPLTWRPYPAEWIADDGMIDIERLCGKVDMATAYAYTEFTSAREREVLLKVGSDDSLMLWLNGEKVFEYPDGRAAKRDQNEVKVKLKAGKNVVLAKVFDIVDAWRLYFRITDTEGRPIGDLGGGAAG